MVESESNANSTGEESAAVSVKAHFSFPSEIDSSPVEQTFDTSNFTQARLGLPDGVEAVKPKGGDYSYSGMHDHGPLPKPKQGGDIALLINLVKEAQKNSDVLLTRIIEKEKSAGRQRISKDGNDKKRAKVDH